MVKRSSASTVGTQVNVSLPMVTMNDPGLSADEDTVSVMLAKAEEGSVSTNDTPACGLVVTVTLALPSVKLAGGFLVSTAWAETPSGPWIDTWASPNGLSPLQFTWTVGTFMSPIGHSSVPTGWPLLSKTGRGGIRPPKGVACTRSACAACTALVPIEAVPRAL